MGQEQIELVEFASAKIPCALELSYEQMEELTGKDDEEKAPYELLDESSKEEAWDDEEEVTKEKKEESNEGPEPHQKESDKGLVPQQTKGINVD